LIETPFWDAMRDKLFNDVTKDVESLFDDAIPELDKRMATTK
jgi:hypothetical protein